MEFDFEDDDGDYSVVVDEAAQEIRSHWQLKIGAGHQTDQRGGCDVISFDAFLAGLAEGRRYNFPRRVLRAVTEHVRSACEDHEP